MEALVQPGLLIFSFLWSRTLISTIDLSGFNQCKIAVWQMKKEEEEEEEPTVSFNYGSLVICN